LGKTELHKKLLPPEHIL